MKAIKGNKVYTITESEQALYKQQGYDIANDEGKVIAYGAGRSVSFEEYLKLKEELDLVKQENQKLKDENKKLKAGNKEVKKS